ncbi:glycosyltransferase family 2 protein [Tunturiibacter gelidiferens]|uniref:glycosyltransferase family 2 protein n=1 Tax=Tunturiibacter gelidiferens TaxID=3069689 RepID=UPI003D9B8359
MGTARFFSSLQQQEFKDFHVWAIDNVSNDDSVAQCRAQGDRFTVIANEKNVGVAAGNNQGIYAALNAGCEHILLLNNDVEFDSQLFARLIEGLTANACQMTAPLMYYYDRPNVIWAAGGKFQPMLGYRCIHLNDGVEDVGQFNKARRIEHAPTCCVLFKRSVFDQVGFMDERYFVYHDDTDFMLRCLKANQRLFLLPNAKLLHKVSSLTGGAESEFSVRMGTRNRIYMLSKFLGRLLAFPYVAGLSLVYLIRKLLRQYNQEQYQLKQLSLRQGFEMATNWLPYKQSR